MNERPHSRFRDRVWIEREVITAVNRAFKIDCLHGLTDSAIAKWQCNVVAKTERERAILASVSEIARRSKLHVDTSRDVFDDEGIPELSSIERLIQELQTLAAV